MAHKIVIIGLENLNLGDRVIEDTCKYLVKDLAPDLKIKTMNLFPEEELLGDFQTKYPKTDVIIEKISQKYGRNFICQMLDFSKWYRYSKKGTSVYKYYEDNLKKSKMVIIAGGGLIKYSRENFWNALYSIISYCSRARIHVYFNAVGIEGFDKSNFYCRLLKYSLSKKCVKVISTRDDIETLKKYVSNKKTELKVVGDPALWSVEKYELNDIQKNDIVGVGLIRGKIFTDYGTEFSEEQILQAYVGIVKELESRGYRWQLFCNGLKSDYKMGKDILNFLGLPVEEQYLAPRPTKAKSLVKRISEYKAIIGARLHSNIIAAAYNVPSVALIWNEKLKFFGKQINHTERFFNKNDFQNPKFVVDKLEQAMFEGYNEPVIKNLKLSTKESLQKFINKELRNCKK